MQDNLRDLAQCQLDALDKCVRLIVVHPQYRQAYSLRAALLEQECVYVCLSGDEVKQPSLQAQVSTALREQAEDEDMRSLRTLIIDESDRALPKALDSFIASTLEQSPHCRIFVLGRRVPDVALNTLRDVTTFIPHENETMLWDYTSPIAAKHLLEVHAFGEGQVYLDGKHIQNWEGTLPCALFFYLVDRGMATRTDIFKTFWTRMNKQEATNVFHVTKRKIGEILGLDLTEYNSGYYHIVPDIEVRYDTHTFNWLMQNSAIADLQERERLLYQALNVYRGPFLAHLDMPWANKRRLELAEDAVEALMELATHKSAIGDDQGALNVYIKAFKIAASREDLTAALMQLYGRLGQPSDALKVYQHFVEGLKHDQHMRVSAELKLLAEHIQAQR